MSDNCTNNNSDLGYYLVPIGAGISIICYIIIFILYFVLQLPLLQRHPTSIAIHKFFFEFIFISQFIWSPFQSNSFFWSMNDGACVANFQIAIFSWITQFSLLGSELWFFILSLDLYVSITNPFQSFKKNLIYYKVFVYSLSIISGFILISLGPTIYGLDGQDPMIWIQSNPDEIFYRVIFFYIWMFAILFYCSFIYLFARNRISKGLKRTLITRLSVIKRAQTYLLFYSCFWIVYVILYAINLVYDNTTCAVIYKTLLSSRGIVSLLVILVPNWNELKRNYMKVIDSNTTDSFHTMASNLTDVDIRAITEKVNERLSPESHLNIALRTEILLYTTSGIRLSIQEYLTSTSSVNNNLRRERNNSIYSFQFNDLDKFKREFDNDYGPDDQSFINSNLSTSIIKSSIIGSSKKEYEEELNKIDQEQRASMVNDYIYLAKDELKKMNKSLRRIDNIRNSFIGGTDSTRGSEMNKWDRDSNMSQDLNFSAKNLNGRNSNTFISGVRSFMGGTISSQQSSSISKTISLTKKPKSKEHLTETDQIVEEDHIENGNAMHNTLDSTSNKKNYFPARATHIIDGIHSIMTARPYSQSSNFIFKDYAPDLFGEMRKISNIDDNCYFESFQSSTNAFFDEKESGSFRFYSLDKKYLVNTVSYSEFTKLLDMLPQYINHIKKEQSSLLPRYTSAHSIRMYRHTIYMVASVNYCSNNDLSYEFDLKGAWIDRYNRNGKDIRSRKGGVDTSNSNSNIKIPSFQDNQINECINLTNDCAIALNDILTKDVNFLSTQNNMNYSLLIGVVNLTFEIIDKQAQEPHDPKDLPPIWKGYKQVGDMNPYKKDKDGAINVTVIEGPGTYYFGLTNILTEWSYLQRFQSFIEVYIKRKEATGISLIPPLEYQERFMQRAVREVIFFDEMGIMSDIYTNQNTTQNTTSSNNSIISNEFSPLDSSSSPILIHDSKSSKSIAYDNSLYNTGESPSSRFSVVLANGANNSSNNMNSLIMGGNNKYINRK